MPTKPLRVTRAIAVETAQEFLVFMSLDVKDVEAHARELVDVQFGIGDGEFYVEDTVLLDPHQVEKLRIEADTVAEV